MPSTLRCLRLSLVAMAGLAVGCSPHGEGTVDSFVDALAAEACRAALECASEYGSVPFWEDGADGTSFERCVAFHRTHAIDLPVGLAAGRVRFDAPAADDYLAAAENACGTTDAARDAYARVFVGLRGAGESCAANEECGAGLRCTAAYGACGTCIARGAVALGGECTFDDECAGADTGAIVCVADDGAPSVCSRIERRLVGEGETCRWIVASGTERVDGICARGLYCRRADADADVGVCRPPVGEGEACTPNVDACAFGTLCRDGDGGMRCRSVEILTTRGATCDETAGLRCSAAMPLACLDGVCQSIGDGSLGASCRVGYAADCLQGLVCDDTTRTCSSPRPLGAPCSPVLPGLCASGRCGGDDPGAPVCVPSDPCE